MAGSITLKKANKNAEKFGGQSKETSGISEVTEEDYEDFWKEWLLNSQERGWVIHRQVTGAKRLMNKIDFNYNFRTTFLSASIICS